MNRIIDKTPVCDTIERLLIDLESSGFVITEQYLRDYHFAELYFKVVGDLAIIEKLNLTGCTQKDNFLICNCHWSSIELIQDDNIEL